MKNNRLWTIILKIAGRAGGFISTLSLRLQTAQSGRRVRAMSCVIINGGKNIRIGSDVYIGRNVVLDASNGEILIMDGTEIRDGTRIYSQGIWIGKKATLAENVFLNGKIEIADGAWIARGCDLSGEVRIKKAILGPGTICVGSGSHDRDGSGAYTMHSTGKDGYAVLINEGSWTGAGSVILGGVTLHTNSVLGAGAVLTKSFPSGSKLAGVPAAPIE